MNSGRPRGCTSWSDMELFQSISLYSPSKLIDDSAGDIINIGQCNLLHAIQCDCRFIGKFHCDHKLLTASKPPNADVKQSTVVPFAPPVQSLHPVRQRKCICCKAWWISTARAAFRLSLSISAGARCSRENEQGIDTLKKKGGFGAEWPALSDLIITPL